MAVKKDENRKPLQAPSSGKRKVVVKAPRGKKKKLVRKSPDDRETSPSTSEPEAPVPNVAQMLAGVPVELNHPSVRDPVEQYPLDPDQVDEHPPPPPEVLGEPTFKFFCYRCGQKMKVPVSWANKSYPCGRCGHDIVIPPPLIGQLW